MHGRYLNAACVVQRQFPERSVCVESAALSCDPPVADFVTRHIAQDLEMLHGGRLGAPFRSSFAM
jgi:hypothetical protein